MILDPNGMPILQPTVDNAETATFNDAFAAIGNTRQIKTYKWADNAARTAQTGMGAGDEGYQTDTDTYYTYDGAAWVATQTTTSGTITPASGITIAGYYLLRYGNVVFLTVEDAKRSSAWSVNAPIATVSPASWRPPLRIIGSAINGATGDGKSCVMSSGGLVTLQMATESGSDQMHLTFSWIVP